ncbi:hypothetical protein J5Y09_15215 [Roseomonas sp. PWR1]|uniref:Uncharacterized protein n=1 Tax=Roseomonas nitratireducens TaxID=2820810 RepID=A0ABS4AV85_9PROT|nr:hypothetical protein [Neoroseomonas nitratireducens]MBP0465274.1 hypothetical protein [Neoroseomonas nitratireducens]
MPIALLIAAALAVVCMPVLAVPVPPLLDYPNHLARLWLLAGGLERPALAAFYEADWRNAFTNGGMDTLVVLLAPLLGGAEPAMRLMLALALVLPPLGAAALNRALFGGWRAWQVGFAVLAFNGILLAGFLSFMIGLGLALLAAAAEPALVRRAWLPRLVVRAAFGVLLIWMHALGLAFYLALLVGLAIGPSMRAALAGPRAIAAAAGRAALAVASAALPAFLMLHLSGTPGPWDGAAEDDTLLRPWSGYAFFEKVRALTTAFGTYEVPVDLAMLLAVLAVARWALAKDRLRVHGGLLAAAGGLLVLAIIMPNTLGGTGWMDRRFPIMALLTFLAAMLPRVPAGRHLAVAAGLLLIVALRAAWMGWVWDARQADIAAVERAIAPMPPGAALLVAYEFPGDRFASPVGRYFPRGQMPTYEHLGALAVTRREAFVPTLFALRGRHVLRVLPPWDELALANGLGVAVTQLDDATAGDARPYLRDWRRRFDYLLVLDGDHPGGGVRAAPTQGLARVAMEGFARLYRIERPGEAAAR